MIKEKKKKGRKFELFPKKTITENEDFLLYNTIYVNVYVKSI